MYLGYNWLITQKTLLINAFFVTSNRGVPRIFCRGFPQVVDPRRGDLGAQLPDADELLNFLY